MGRPAIDLTGQVFGRLTVIERTKNANDGHARWLCRCSCGNIITASSNVLKKGNCLSCGCLRKETASIKAKQSFIDLTNKRFGKLIAKRPIGSNGKDGMLWQCECDCGNKNFITTSHHLNSGNTQSCGCLKSKGEEIIKKLLTTFNIEYEQQKSFDDLPLKRFDFYLPVLNRLIEYDGIQHYQALGGWSTQTNLDLTQKRDEEKNIYALTHNIPLVRIPYWEQENINIEMLLGDQYLIRE